jgi:MFS family permease
VTTEAGLDVGKLQRRTVGTLAVGQALGGAGVSTGISVATLLAERMLGSSDLAGVPQTAQVLGSAVAAFLIARVMTTRGRRPGLAIGYGMGAVGAALCVLSAFLSSFVVLLVGATLFGAATAANHQTRYAATDLAAPDRRATALSIVVWAATIGAVLGPNLVGPADRLTMSLGAPEFAGPFVLGFIGALLAAIVFLVRLRPDPLVVARQLASTDPHVRPNVTIRHVYRVVTSRPRATVAVLSIAFAHTVMVSVMVMTPLHLHHGGAGLEVIGFVISVHVLGMFAFSPLMGIAADRIGRIPLIVIGSVVLLASVTLSGLAPAGSSVGLTVGLFLLGLGWSCCMVASSALLTDSVPLEDRPTVQGASDLAVGCAAAFGAAIAGVIVGTWGYATLNVAAGVLAASIAVLVWIARRATSEPADPSRS